MTGTPNHEPHRNGDEKPDPFNRAFEALSGRPETVKTAIQTIGATDGPLERALAHYTVQTFRVREEGDHILLTYLGADGNFRIALPPKVTACIARQRDALAAKNRRIAARAEAARRKAQGIKPGFLGKRGQGGRRKKRRASAAAEGGTK